MRIKLINPNMTQSMTESIGRCAMKCASKDTDVIWESASFGVNSVECHVDACLAGPAVLSSIRKGELSQDIDAYIIACFDDPGLYAAREITENPVVGIAEAAISAAKFLAPNFSIVTILDRSRLMNLELVRRYGAEHCLRSIRSTGMGVLEFEEDPARSMCALKEQSKKAVEEDGAECILLGCAGFAELAETLRKELGVPVIDGVTAAVKFAEALVTLGQRTSKVNSWKAPEPKTYFGYGYF